jgi:hypothetical protein
MAVTLPACAAAAATQGRLLVAEARLLVGQAVEEEVPPIDLVAARHEHRPLQDRAQLADVPRPR